MGWLARVHAAETDATAPGNLAASPATAETKAADVSRPLVTKAARFYGEQRWPGCRIVSVTPYYAFDGSINAYAVQFAREGSPLETEAGIKEQVAAGEDRLNKVRGSRPKAPIDDMAEAARDMSVADPAQRGGPVFENRGPTTAGIRVVLPSTVVAKASERQKAAALYKERLAAWRRDVRAAANEAVLPDQIGTVLIAARRDVYPLLERFDGVAPHLKFQAKIRRLAAIPKDQPEAVARTFYVGPMAFFHEPATATGTVKATPERVINPLAEQVFDLRVQKATGSQGRLPAAAFGKLAIAPEQFWDSIDKKGVAPKTGEPGPSATPAFPIVGVPYYHQDDYGAGCCGPNATAQALGYWDDNGYGNLVDNGHANNGHEDELIFALMKAQNYNPSNGTYGNKIAPGLVAVCNYNTYGNELSFSSSEIGSPSWGGDIKGEIIHRRPFVYFNWDTNSYPNWAHFTTAMGYNEDAGHILFVNYNYSPDTPYELNWDNISSQNEFMYPVKPGGTPMFDTIWTEDFEDSTLAEWSFRSQGLYPPSWGRTSYRSHVSTPHPSPPNGNPAFSAYCHPWFGSPPGPYVHNMDAMMVLGPFSTYKSSGELSAYIWRRIPDTNGDAIALMASLDGSGFSGTAYFGNVPVWQRCALDFSNVYGLGNILNKSQVWVGIWFVTDSDGPVGEGAYVDDVVIKLEPATHFTVCSPFKGEKWQKGTLHDITWRSLGDFGLGTVRIELYKGLQLETTISNYTPNDGLWAWTVPTWIPAASNYQIKVFNVNQTTEWGYSPMFEVMDPPSLSLATPNGGEVWGRGTAGYIQWSSTGYPGQDVRMVLKRGGSQSTLVSSTPNDGSYTWQIPASQAESADYKVRIISLQNSAIYDESDGTFSILEPGLTVTVPWANRMWERGRTYDIEWTWVGNPGPSVKIELLRQTTSSLVLDHTIVASTANDGSYSWAIPASQEPGDNYMIRITSNFDPSYTDTCDPFRIIVEPSVHLLSPNGGEWWERGTTYPITWTTELPVGRPMKLQLYRGPGGLVPPFLDHTIVASTEDDGHYEWFIPPTQSLASDYRVKLSLATTDAIFDWSDSMFRIMGPDIEVVAPGNGDTWLAGTTRTIVWKTTDMPPSDMMIQLYQRYVGYSMIAPSVPNTGYYAWPIPPSQAADYGYKLKITAVAKPSTFAWNYGTFSIANRAGIVVTSPEPGETWKVGQRHLIRWTQIGIPETDVRVELYKGGALETMITSAPLYANSCPWMIPDAQAPGRDYRIKITSMWDSSYSGFSEWYFSIEPETAVKEPQWPLY